MVARNDITGDAIQTKNSSQTFRDNYDEIFRKNKLSNDVLDAYNEERLVSKYDKKDIMQVRADQLKDGGVSCGCGRSPTGFCIGWHGLSEDEFQKRLAEHQSKQQAQGE